MKHYKLPFNINLERKYNDINIEKYLPDRELNKGKRKSRIFLMDNDLHIELGKFKTFDTDLSEIIDLGMRYALGKQEFRKLAAQVLQIKEQQNRNKG
ncbi:hypothetical protein D1631_05340 [Chryseobacterium nematophagum]|uniref:Uncharacterized protein n=1 Tax=Chryseobacterium nematophagum TaxID=2305228 RepID=A0A3M7TEJ5_9FLAO|nr:hypothetical protein [Chryseobacterium nematophagum]RNA61396.1 hypothetical protein D1631_05340 [Chryseobacterium nematophagum]